MARLRPLRTKEEIDKVPPEKSVTIDLQPEGVVNLEENPFEDQSSQQPPPKSPVRKAPQEEQDDPSDLKRQLEEMKLAKGESDRRIQEEIRARQEAEKLMREREQEAGQSRIRAEDAEYDAILNAIGAAESEAESAERDIAIAGDPSAPDPKRAAEANRRMARAEARLVQLQDGKAAIEHAKTTAATRAKEQPPRRENPTVEQYVDQLPNLSHSQREWLKKHPDALTDNRKNMRLQGAHVEAEDQGLSAGSTEYFEYLEERLGYRKPQMRNDDDDEPAQQRAPVSAPPSRNATNPASGRPTNNQITLTPEQREIARLSGIDDLTYARQLRKLQELKSEGHYQQN
jgi:hypothetical protein